MTAYLHIGTPKTGTTSIQNFLIDNIYTFMDKIGYTQILLEQPQEIIGILLF